MSKKFNVYNFLLEKIKCKYIVQDIIEMANNNTTEIIAQRKLNVYYSHGVCCDDFYKYYNEYQNKKIYDMCGLCKEYAKTYIRECRRCWDTEKELYRIKGRFNNMYIGRICEECAGEKTRVVKCAVSGQDILTYENLNYYEYI